MSKIFCLVSIARAGKSTYAAKWLEERVGEKAVIISSDSLRLTITGQRYVRSAEPLVHATTRIMVMDFFRNGYQICIDETNTTLQSLKNWLEIDPDLEFVYIEADPEECKRRAYATGQPDLVEKGVIDRHAENIKKLCFLFSDKFELSLNESAVMHSLENIREFYKEGKL